MILSHLELGQKNLLFLMNFYFFYILSRFGCYLVSRLFLQKILFGLKLKIRDHRLKFSFSNTFHTTSKFIISEHNSIIHFSHVLRVRISKNCVITIKKCTHPETESERRIYRLYEHNNTHKCKGRKVSLILANLVKS